MGTEKIGFITEGIVLCQTSAGKRDVEADTVSADLIIDMTIKLRVEPKVVHSYTEGREGKTNDKRMVYIPGADEDVELELMG